MEFYARLLAVTAPVEIARSIVSPFAGLANYDRFGLASRFFHGASRIGDDLMCSTVVRELRKRGFAIATPNAGMFQLCYKNRLSYCWA